MHIQQNYHLVMWKLLIATGNAFRRLGYFVTDRGWGLINGPARRHFYETQQGKKMIAEIEEQKEQIEALQNPEGTA